MAKCGKQGQPFSWCIVHQDENCSVDTLKDPTGIPHLMVEDPSKSGHATMLETPTSMYAPATMFYAPALKMASAFSELERLQEKIPGQEQYWWDYCVPPTAQAEEEKL